MYFFRLEQFNLLYESSNVILISLSVVVKDFYVNDFAQRFPFRFGKNV